MNALTRKRLRNQNYIFRSKLRNDYQLKGKEDRENEYFVSRASKNDERCSRKIRIKRNPLPMKFRTLPQSFWQQPNKTLIISQSDCANNAEKSSKNNCDARSSEEMIMISDANTELLFSLFKSVEEGQMLEENQKSGKKKRVRKTSKVLRDDDPYLASSITENLLPLLPVRNKVERLQQEQVHSRNSPMSCGLSNNYSQILSQLVVQL